MANERIIFMGTPDIASAALELVHSALGVGLVVTVADKPAGRGLALKPSDVKLTARKLGIPLLQPESLKDESFIASVEAFQPDIIVVVAFRILPRAVYSLARLGAFNVHASLLPKYRGAAPINWAVINGDRQTGVTSFLLGDKVDTGNLLLQKSIPLPPEMTAGDLYEALKPEVARLALETCRLLIGGKYEAFRQDESLASPAPKLFPEMCKIDWPKDAPAVKNFIHGTSPVPGAWTIWNGKRLKVFRCELAAAAAPAGTFIIKNNEFIAGCSDGAIKLTEIQPEGKRAMPAAEFLKGYRGATEGRFD